MSHVILRDLSTILCVMLGMAGGACAAPAERNPERDMDVWTVDPLVKVFPDATPETDEGAPGDLADAARGEHATWQAVLRANVPLREVRATCEALKPDGHEGKSLPRPSVRFVGYVPVGKPTQTPSMDQLRKPPALYPDPLLDQKSASVKAGEAQPVWVTVRVPESARPGRYRATLRLSARTDAGIVKAEVPLALRVYDVTVGPSRLTVTNWFSTDAHHMKGLSDPKSAAYWQVLRRYARNMAEHRQNAALIPPLSLATFSADKDGALEIDWTTFDRWVKVFQEEGVLGTIEGGHLGGRVGGWESPFGINIRKIEDGKVVEASADPTGEEADRFTARFLPALVAHLREKGWLSSYVQHLADEPTNVNVASYRAMAALVRKHAPELRIIEATHAKDLTGSIDVWVPELDYLHRDIEHYKARQKAGDEVWFYTCVFPQGEYANRFIELPLIKTRLLHWINARYGITGYLHWGYNFWGEDDPYTHLNRPHPGPPYLPAGDAWIVYPGKDGPIDSIRWEAMRDGIADYELLAMLNERNPRAARRLAERHILDFDLYDTSVAAFRATRREMLDALSNTPSR